MTNPFFIDRADDYRLLKQKIAPMVHRSDLMILVGNEITEFTKYDLRFLGISVCPWSKVRHHSV